MIIKAIRELYMVVVRTYVGHLCATPYSVYRGRTLCFPLQSLRAKNMRGIENACVVSASTTCMEPFAESAEARYTV